MSSGLVRAQAFTHPGAARAGNEDRIAVGDWSGAEAMTVVRVSIHDAAGPFAAMVCDGMGGHTAGEIASALAVDVLAPALTRPVDAAALTAALRKANGAVFAAAAERPERRGMGATAAGLHFGPAGLFWFNVGDSRVFRLRDGFLRQLSVDDVGPAGGLTQALGGADGFLEIDPHVGAEPLTAGWRYLICSDGLTDMVPPEAIEVAISEAPETALERLFATAMAAGGRDNISMILLSVED